MLNLSENFTELTQLIDESTPGVLATVVRTHGSTPQKPGSSALIGSGNLLAGTVGGGISESRVIQEARDLLSAKKSKIMSFDLHGEIEKGSESICGGGMTILLDGNPDFEVFKKLANSLLCHVPGVLTTTVRNDENPEIERFWVTDGNADELSAILPETVKTVIFDLLRKRVAGCEFIEIDASSGQKPEFVFLEYLVPAPSLVIAGAGHIGRALAHLGKFLGFAVTVWDDRPEFARKELIPDADFVYSGTIENALGKMKIGDDSYFVVVTHGHKNDAEVLRKIIALPSAYLGMIGSRAKVAQMKDAFLSNGWATPELWERIYTPIGLKLGGQSVEEIAVSIAAQLVQVRNAKNNGQ